MRKINYDLKILTLSYPFDPSGDTLQGLNSFFDLLHINTDILRCRKSGKNIVSVEFSKE